MCFRQSKKTIFALVMYMCVFVSVGCFGELARACVCMFANILFKYN